MKNRVVSLLMAVLLVLPLWPVVSYATTHFAGSGTETDPFIISNAADWAQFAEDVNAGVNADTYYKLSDNFENEALPVTATVGTSDNPFCGIFDGNGRTLSVLINDSTDQGTAPFRYTAGAVIKNLTVTGTVSGTTYSSGLVGFASTQNAIENCTVNVSVSAPGTREVHHLGGVVGHALSSALYMTGTVFTGTLDIGSFQAGDSVGGLIGVCDDGAQIRLDHCLFAGQHNENAAKCFHPVAARSANADVDATVDSLYYTLPCEQLNDEYVVTNEGRRLYVPGQDQLIMRTMDVMGYPLGDENCLVGIDGPSAFPYTGEVIDLNIYTLTQNDGRTLTMGTDYVVSVSKGPFKDIGTYVLTFTGIGEYAGSAERSVFIGATDYTLIKSGSSAEWSDGYYVADGNASISKRIEIRGEVHLYLCSGASLTAKEGIHVPEGASLVIDAADDRAVLNAYANTNFSGIGCNVGENAGAITINGGKITAIGGPFCAGIGCGFDRMSGTVTINGGTVAATGAAKAAGISGESVTINGGTVTADTGNAGAGIGGGAHSNGGTVTINGGTVTATGGSNAAGIGGGFENVGITVTINGGTVTANGGSSAAGIGGGYLGNGANVTINGGNVTANREQNGTGIGNALYGEGAVIVLGWTNESDSIYASSYSGSVSFSENKRFIRSDNGVFATAGNIGGVSIVPFTGAAYRVSLSPLQHGSASVSHTLAPAGQTVTVDFSVNEYPFMLDSVSVTGTVSGNIDFEYTGANRLTFCMPDEDVTVTIATVSAPTVSVVTMEGTVDCAPIVPNKTTYETGWYAVTGTVEFTSRMVISGDVKIHLREGSRLILGRGVTVSSGNTLTIEGSGYLLANASGVSYSAGIGGAGDGGHCGTVFIRGGVIDARGGSRSAGIGGGYRGSGGNITISGGTVQATGGYLAPGIGGGDYADGGYISVIGGKVTATGSYYTAGIGHAYDGWGGRVLLGWASANDYIESTGYSGTVTFAEGKNFLRADTMDQVATSSLGSFRIVPAAGERYTITTVMNGTGEGSVSSNVPSAIAGQNVRFTLNYTYPSLFGSFTVTDVYGNVYEAATADNRTFTLVMPANNITVTTVFNSAEIISRNTTEGARDCLVLSTDTLSYSSGWYTVKENTTFPGRLVVSGNVKIYIPEGITLTCSKGITVSIDNSLTIEGGGTLISDARGIGNAAGIGGIGKLGHCGTVVIHGCTVEAYGGNYGAGIGGGYYGSVSSVTITAGTVTAIGGAYAAGIGGGEYGLGGDITITGGKVTAHGSNTAGIGYGYQSGRRNEIILLGWTNADDFIDSNGYNGVVEFVRDCAFLNAVTMEEVAPNALGSFKILPKAGQPYYVFTDKMDNGIYGESIAASVEYAVPGQTVRITLSYSYPSFLEELTIFDTSNNPVDFTTIDNKHFTFVMPESVVGVIARFSYAAELPIQTSEGTENFMALAEDNYTYQSGLYTSDADLTFTQRVVISGTVRLYLYENTTLTFSKGITVLRGSSLTIEGSGTLIADARNVHSAAGIGGTVNAPFGDIMIKSGNVTAYGGNMGAGIGGGGMTITDNPAEGGNIGISGGTVEAYGGSRACGIGSGAYGNGGTIDILGGTVTAVKGGGLGITGIGCVGGYIADIQLGWSDVNDYIDTPDFGGTVAFAAGKFFKLADTGAVATVNNINGHRLIPAIGCYTISMSMPNVQAKHFSVRSEDQLVVENMYDDRINSAPAGIRIVVTISLKYPYDFDSVSIVTNSGVSVPVTLESNDTYPVIFSFIMPEDGVTITPLLTLLRPVTRMTPEGEFTFMPFRPYMTDWGKEENKAFGVNFVVDRDFEDVWDIYIFSGTAKLYLDAGTTLKCGSIECHDECEGITIYGEGTLIAQPHTSTSPGIGRSGNITIYSGTIIAYGVGAAGIGGNGMTDTLSITIHGGNITAVGGYGGAGIGGGHHQTPDQITINGGTVTAVGGYSSAGIGGGYFSAGGDITINGGIVTAIGGLEGAGIGGGNRRSGGNITINGGIINATGGGSRNAVDKTNGYGAGIGDGPCALPAETNIVITGGQITARGDWQTDWSQAGYPRVSSFDIGPGWKSECEVHVTLGWTDSDDYIDASLYGVGGTLAFVADRQLLLDGSNTAVTAENVNSGVRLVPNSYSLFTSPVTGPAGNSGLTYSGAPQTLVQPGSAIGGTIKYCVSDRQPSDADYSASLPTATEPGIYTVWYKAFGDEYHLDSLPYSVVVTISKCALDHLTVELSQTVYTYDRRAKAPAVTLKNGSTVIDPSEYTVTYADNVCAGTAAAIVSAAAGGHYIFTAKGEFVIEPLPVTVAGLFAENKLYDSTTAALVSGTPVLNGVLASDDVTLVSGQAEFDTPYLGTGKTVTFSGYALGGTDAGNYTLVAQPANVEADITALPVGLGSTNVELTEYVWSPHLFTPEYSDLYRFSANDSAFPAFFIYEGETLICENMSGFYIGYFDEAIELEAGKDYLVLLYSIFKTGEMTLTIERAPLCAITVDENVAHGMIVDCIEEARMGDMVSVFTEAEDGFALNRLIVTTSDGEIVEAGPDGFIMPGKPVTVSAVFGALHTVNFECSDGVELWEFSPHFYANDEFSRPDEEETFAAYGAEIEIELWGDGLHVLSVSVTTASGDELPVTYYGEYGMWIIEFTMPDGDVTVTLTLTENADLNKDGTANVSDVSTLLDLLSTLEIYVAAYDLNGDGLFSISDVSTLLDYLANL